MRRTALVWILLGSGISIWWGFSVGQNANGWVDFRAVYYGTRCLLEHHNPYKVSELEGVYRADGGERPSETVQAHQAVVLYVNMPTTFIVVAPFAVLPWGLAHVLWVVLTAGVFILAALLMWDLGASYAPGVSLFLICILLVNCESIFVAGNTAGIAVSLCVLAAWCFLRERFVPAGILCLALSLAIKPHDAGLVWLYFLLAGGVYRKRALQTFFITAILGLSAFLWVSHVAPHWMQDWQSNLATISAPGGINEPGPASLTGRSACMVIDLQAAISIFLGRCAHLQSGQLPGVRRASAGVVGAHFKSAFFARQRLACARRGCASHHARHLSSAVGCEAADARRSGLRLAVGRRRPDGAACVGVDDRGAGADRRRSSGNLRNSGQEAQCGHGRDRCKDADGCAAAAGISHPADDVRLLPLGVSAARWPGCAGRRSPGDSGMERGRVEAGVKRRRGASRAADCCRGG